MSISTSSFSIKAGADKNAPAQAQSAGQTPSANHIALQPEAQPEPKFSPKKAKRKAKKAKTPAGKPAQAAKSAQPPADTSPYGLAMAAYEAKDYPRTVTLLKPLAENGIPQAQHFLAAMYYAGMGVSKDCMEATHWYGAAAKQGYAKAQFTLGALYYVGECVP